MKTIHCGDLVPGCDFKARADSEADLMQKVSAHVRDAHPEVTLTPHLMQSIKDKTRES